MTSIIDKIHKPKNC